MSNSYLKCSFAVKTTVDEADLILECVEIATFAGWHYE